MENTTSQVHEERRWLLAKMRRAKALAVRSMRWDPDVHGLLSGAKVALSADGAGVSVVFPDAVIETFDGNACLFSFGWIEGGSVEQVAEGLATVARRLTPSGSRAE